MQWISSKDAPEKAGEYACKTSKGRIVVAEKKEDVKYLVVKNPHYLRNNEKIILWLDEENQNTKP